MLRLPLITFVRNSPRFYILPVHQRSFLTNVYNCTEEWNARFNSDIIKKVNLDDFYNIIDQQNSSKGIISAIDVDIFANAIKDSYLDELRDLLYKLRLSAETGNMLESTHHATIRNYLEFGQIQDLIEILADPINYGVFMDDYTTNILLDKLIKEENFEKAAIVASIYMLQENYSNDITCSLCLYACYKYLRMYPTIPRPEPIEEKPQKVEEVKIRIKYVRNPYFDDHFDIQDKVLLAGKSLAWISATHDDDVHLNLQLLGWFNYKKFDNFAKLADTLLNEMKVKMYPEVLQLIKDNIESSEENKNIENILKNLESLPISKTSLETDLSTKIENAINKNQKADIEKQKQLFQLWEKQRFDKLQEQSLRLERAAKLVEFKQKQEALITEEQRLWFFDNEDKIELEIETKKNQQKENTIKSKGKATDDYIPPEVKSKRKSL